MNKLIKVLFSVAIMATTVLSSNNKVEASSNHIDLLNVVHKLETTSGQDLTNATQYTEIKSVIDFDLPSTTKAGDYTTITIPNQVYFSRDITETLVHRHTDGKDYPFATMNINANDGTVTLTYLPDVERFSNIKGNMFFINRLDQQQVTDGQTVTLEFQYGTETVAAPPFDYGYVGDSTDELFNKYNWFKEGSSREIVNEIRVNPSGQTYSRPIVKDQLHMPASAMTYDQSTFKIYKGEWGINDKGVWQMGPRLEIYPNNQSQFQTPIVTFDLATNSFEVDFGDHTASGPNGAYIGEYKINYSTIANYDILPGEVVKNYAALYDATTKIKETTVSRKLDSAGGSTEGYQYGITVNKVDGNDSALAGATFELTRQKTNQVVSSGVMTSGSYTFTGLLYDTYILREVSAPTGYVLDSTEYIIEPQDFGNGVTFTQKVVNHSFTTISGTKTWVDNNNQDGLRPQGLTLTLFADGVEVVSVTPTWIKNGNVWTYEYANLPQYKDGNLINYSVSEETVLGYTSTQDGFNFTNTHAILVTSITGTKTWVDNNNQDGLRPQDLVLKLFANGVEVVGVTPTWVKNGNVWTYEYTNLPQFKNGNLITYSVSEENVAGYTSAQDGNNFTNSHVPGTTFVSGTKTWVDNDNQDGLRPQDLVLTLFADGVEVVGVTPTWVKNGNVWTYEYANLPQYKDGKLIIYTVSEEAVTGYSSTQDGFNFINTHAILVTSITGTKIWLDQDDKFGYRPEAITVRIYADGIEIENVTPVWVKNSNTWTYTFEELPMYREQSLITYTITEDAVDKYTTKYDGFDITNTVIVEDVESEVIDKLPGTGVATRMSGPILMALGSVLMLVKRRKKA